jgi:hypothetical protein
MYVKSRLHDKDRKIRNYILFFRPNGILPVNKFTEKKTKPVPAGKIIQLTK